MGIVFVTTRKPLTRRYRARTITHMKDESNDDGLGQSEEDRAATQHEAAPDLTIVDRDAIVDLNEWRATHREAGWPE